MSEEFEELSEDERRRFQNLPREKSPPAYLENKILQTLKKEGFIKEEKMYSYWNKLKLATAFGVTLVILMLGIGIGYYWNTDSDLVAKNDSSKYLLLLRSTSVQTESLTAEELQKRVSEYGKWADEIAKKGYLLQGEKLKNKSQVLDKAQKQTINDSIESKVVGFFLIKAENYDQAVSIANDCPHLKYEGQVEIREIDQTR